jgi:hypothetical protein
MAFGIDTSQAHLDLLKEIRAAADFAAADPAGSFFTWNGGARPVFAGRNFLGQDFIWGHSEATNASREPSGDGQGHAAHYPLPATDPSPEQQQNLTVLVDRIAPMQASHTRQQTTGDMGRVLGQIDGDALCQRLVNGIVSGEFSLGLLTHSFLDVWLCIDPTVPLSPDYWAGWANVVNNATVPVGIPGVLQPFPQQLFRACVFCTYTAGADQILRPDAALTTALAVNHSGMITGNHGFWADFKLFDNAPADLVANGSPLLDFTRFDAATAPKLWRFANGYTDTTGATPAVSFHLDAASPTLTPTDTMLQAQQWQPSIATLGHIGFSNTDALTDANMTCIQRTAWPDMDDNNFVANAGHFHVPGGKVTVIGRYIRPDPASSMNYTEVQRVAGIGVPLFTIWEGARQLAGMGLAESSMQEDHNLDPPPDWGDFTANFHKHIFYFNPDPDGNPATHDDAGTLDGTAAFAYVGGTLKQPPQTPIFFAIDFNPFDIPDAASNPAWPGPGPMPATWTRNWPASPAVPVRLQWIQSYYQNIKTARDAYAKATGRYYLIGAYCSGGTLDVLYAQGIVSHFWQANSNHRTGSRPPRWPYFHANRWQYHSQKTWDTTPHFCALTGADPDADWGAGGTWSWLDKPGFALTSLENAMQHLLDQQFEDFLHPPALRPPPLPPF